jgi:hypothetical protein
MKVYCHLRGIGYAYLSGYFAIKVFLMCRRPTPCAPRSTNVRLWNAGSPTAEKEEREGEKCRFIIQNCESFLYFTHLEPSRLLRMSLNPADRTQHCALQDICPDIASSCG